MTFIKRIKKGDKIYLSEVKSVREGKKVRHEFIRYVGKEIDGKQMLSGSIQRARIDKVSVYGTLLIIDAVAKDIGLSELLGENGDYLLSLAYGQCIAPNSTKKLAEWFERTDISSLLNIPDLSYKKLLEALDNVQGERGDFLQTRIFDRLKERIDLKPEGYFYDVTNAYFYGLHCPLAKKKKKPKNMNLPQIQIGLAVTKDESIPIFHKVFEGNIHDARTLKDIMFLFREHDIENAFMVWDRGVTSKTNIEEAKEAGFEVLCGLALKGNAKSVTEQVISEENLNSIKYRVRLRSTTFYVKKIPYSYGDFKGHLYVCLNEKERQNIKERRYDEIDNAIELLAKKEKIKEGLKKYISNKNGINHQKVKEAEIFDGVSAIFSTKNMKEKEAIHGYFEKDRIEKAFRTLKSLLEMDKIRFWMKDKVKAHIFVCYLSYLLLSLLDYKLQKLGISATDALRLMESMHRVYITDTKTKNTFIKTVALTKQQEDILKAINPKLMKCSQ